MRKLFARCTALPAFITLLIAGSLFAAQACTAGDGATPTCQQDVTANGNQNNPDGCNKFAACRDGSGNVVPDEMVGDVCCKDADGKPFQGQLLELCKYGYGAPADLSSSASGGTGSGGAGGGK